MRRITGPALGIALASIAFVAPAADALPGAGFTPFLGVTLATTDLHVAEGSGAATREESGRGVAITAEAGITLPIPLTLGALYRRIDGSVDGDAWGLRGDEVGGFAEWRMPLGPLGLAGVETGGGGSVSVLAIEETQHVTGRVYGFAGLPILKRLSILARAGYAFAEVQSVDTEQTADYSGVFFAGGLRLALF